MFFTNKRKDFFKHEIGKIEKIISALPFRFEVKREGLKQIREGIRQDFDRLREEMDAINIRIDEEKKKEKIDTALLESFVKGKTNREADTKQMEQMMKDLDKELEELEILWKKKMEGARAFLLLLKRLK